MAQYQLNILIDFDILIGLQSPSNLFSKLIGFHNWTFGTILFCPSLNTRSYFFKEVHVDVFFIAFFALLLWRPKIVANSILVNLGAKIAYITLIILFRIIFKSIIFAIHNLLFAHQMFLKLYDLRKSNRLPTMKSEILEYLLCVDSEGFDDWLLIIFKNVTPKVSQISLVIVWEIILM